MSRPGLSDRRSHEVGSHDRERLAAGQLNISGSVPAKRASLLNALRSSLPAGQKRARERCPERPRRALLHAGGALCANAVHARVVLTERRRSRKRVGEKRNGPGDRSPRPLLKSAGSPCVSLKRTGATTLMNGSDCRTRTCDPAVNSRRWLRQKAERCPPCARCSRDRHGQSLGKPPLESRFGARPKSAPVVAVAMFERRNFASAST